MWKYKNITRQEFEIRKNFVERVMTTFGAIPIKDIISYKILSCDARNTYEYKNEFFRVSEVFFQDKPFIVIEWTDNIEHVKNNVMEDIELFPFDLSDNVVVEKIKEIFLN